jgi:hypothetical protein
VTKTRPARRFARLFQHLFRSDRDLTPRQVALAQMKLTTLLGANA